MLTNIEEIEKFLHEEELSFPNNTRINISRDEVRFLLKTIKTLQSGLSLYQNAACHHEVIGFDDMRDKIRQGILDSLSNTYDCNRVWSAWAFNTMSSDDFSPVCENEERVEEIVDAVLYYLNLNKSKD